MGVKCCPGNITNSLTAVNVRPNGWLLESSAPPRRPRGEVRPAFYPAALAMFAAAGCAVGGGTIVEPPLVRSVTVEPQSVLVVVGGQPRPLIASTDAAGGAPRSVVWSSSDPSVAHVVANGQAATVAGMKPGTAWIVAAATADASKRDSAWVSVTAGTLASLTISAAASSVVAFTNLQVVAVAKDAAGNNVGDVSPVWSSSDPAIATVSASGLVTGKSPGTANITASLGTVTSNPIALTVTNPEAASITLSTSLPSLMAFGTLTVLTVVKDAAGNTLSGVALTWTSSAPSIATVSSSGVVTGKSAGSVTIIAATGAIVSNALALTVVNPSVASITISAATTTLVTSGILQVQALVRDAAGNVLNNVELSWGSSTPGVAAVSNTGLVTATSPGQARITAAAGSVVSNVLSLTVVSAPLVSITVTPASVSLAGGATQQFSAVGRDAGGNLVAITPVWSVVAGGGAISASGLFTAGGAPGTFANTVTAAAGGKSATASVTVTLGPLATITVSPNPVSLGRGATRQFTAVGRDGFGNTVVIVPEWSVAVGGGTIDPSGLFTAGMVSGTYPNTVTATSSGKTGTATVSVSPPALATITVSPDPVSLAAGATQQFTAVGLDADGLVVPITPVWSVVSGGGTISASGLFTAGTAAGSYANTVTASSGGKTGTASVVVTASPLATITVTPNAVILPEDSRVQFTAVGTDAAGNIVPISPVWTVVAGGGTISSSGSFKAGDKTGIFLNTVKATSGGISGTATVTVTGGGL